MQRKWTARRAWRAALALVVIASIVAALIKWDDWWLVPGIVALNLYYFSRP